MIQLVHGSPATPPAGTRPDAIAPTTAPMQYGTITDESANAAPKLRFELVRVTALRNAKPEPRSTMPRAAIVSGTNTVSVIDAYASGKHVHSTTQVKISQTWFASHTGPIECSITARGRAPALGASGDEVPEPGAEVGAAEHGVGDDADEQARPRRRCSSDRPLSSRSRRRGRGPYGTSSSPSPSSPGTAGSSGAAPGSVVTATPMYSASTPRKVIHTPVLPVAASSTFIRL